MKDMLTPEYMFQLNERWTVLDGWASGESAVLEAQRLDGEQFRAPIPQDGIEVVVWVSRNDPLPGQLDDLSSRYGETVRVLQFTDFYDAGDLQEIVDTYRPAAIAAVLDDETMAVLKRLYDGPLLRPKIKKQGRRKTHQYFYQIIQLEVEAWTEQ